MRHLQTFRLIESVVRAGSIRRAAEGMNITPSALNRRIRGFEEDFGCEIFERMPKGVRLNPAGELLIQHIRSQISDLARVQSQVADLTGVRRGRVSIACSQALLPYFLPEQIARYRRAHPGVSFTVNVRDRRQAERDLSTYSSDVALVFEPLLMADFELLAAVEQPVCAVFAADHPLARRDSLRLRDCLDHPHVLPSQPYAVRHLLEVATQETSRRLDPIAESDSFEFMGHYVRYEQAVYFQFPVGLTGAREAGLVVRPLPERDVTPGHLRLGQLKGRTLPVASALFARQLQEALLH